MDTAPLVLHELSVQERLRRDLSAPMPSWQRRLAAALLGPVVYGLLAKGSIAGWTIPHDLCLAIAALMVIVPIEFRLARTSRRLDALIDVIGRDEIERRLVERMRRANPTSASVSPPPVAE